MLGFLLRKGIRVAAAVAGLFLAVLALLEGGGYVKVDWRRMVDDLARFFLTLYEKAVALDAAGLAGQGAPLLALLGGAALGWWLAGRA